MKKKTSAREDASPKVRFDEDAAEYFEKHWSPMCGISCPRPAAHTRQQVPLNDNKIVQSHVIRVVIEEDRFETASRRTTPSVRI